MQKDQENHFDESIRRKLQEEEYMAPPFSFSMQQKAGSGFSWLRGFLLGDFILLLSLSWLSLNFSGIQSASSAVNTDHAVSAFQVAEKVSNSNYSTESSGTLISENGEEAAQSKDFLEIASLSNSTESVSETKRLSTASFDKDDASNLKSADEATLAQDFSAGNSLRSNNEIQNEELSNVQVPAEMVSQSDAEAPAAMGLMKPLDFNFDISGDYTLRTRDFSHTPDPYRKPFALDLMLIGEKTLGYNRVYPEVSQLNLDLTPRDNGFGAGVLFSYRIVKRISILSGIETVFRKYNLNYTYTRSSMVQQPDGSYKEMEEVLRNSRAVSEAEVRLPFLATYTFDAGKWQFEPAAGFTIKFKNLNVSANGSDQIPAVLLSTIEVSNEHLVTAGWMFSCSAGYQLFDNSLIFIAPFYQAESFGKNSRQYYSGRAVSGAGLKAGMRILFYQPR